jgi:hypothetical protein
MFGMATGARRIGAVGFARASIVSIIVHQSLKGGTSSERIIPIKSLVDYFDFCNDTKKKQASHDLRRFPLEWSEKEFIFVIEQARKNACANHPSPPIFLEKSIRVI